MSTKNTKKTIDASVLTLAVVGSIIMLNLIAAATYLGRMDMTRDGQFTLASATEDTLRRLHDPVTVRAYFSREMPPQLASISRYVQDLLDEYAAKGGEYLKYEFIDPVEQESEEDKEKKKDVKQDVFGRQFREMTDVERELQTLGIPGVNVKVREGESAVERRVYMGIAVHYGSDTEVIPVVQDTSTLEYDLTSLIRKLTRDSTPKLAFITGEGSPVPQEKLGQLHGLLSQLYDISTIDMTTETTIADDIDAIIVLASRSPYSDAAKRAIDAYVTGGGSAAFLLDPLSVDLQTLQTEDYDHGLTELLAKWGVTIEKGLVLDAECDSIGIARRIGPLVVPEPVRYVYMPLIKALEGDHPLTQGLGNVVFPFMSPVELSVPEGSAVSGEVLVRSSSNSWVEAPPHRLDPTYRWTKEDAGELSSQELVVTLRGPLESFYGANADAPVLADEEGGEDAPTGGKAARVLVAGGTGFIDAQMIRNRETNLALMMNLTDWLLSDEALLAMRARGLASAPIDPELKDGTKSTIKYLNIVGVPLALVIFGIARWRMRESRRSKVKL